MQLQQLQQNFQSILMQKQHLEAEKAEVTTALDELKKADDGRAVYKQVGMIMIKSTRDDLTLELEEKKELANTRTIVLQKQEEKIQKSMQEYESKLTQMMRNPGQGHQQPKN